MTYPPLGQRTRVAVRTHTGRTEHGYATGWFPDGAAYVVLDQGSPGTFPAGSVTVIEDKDMPRQGFETK